MEERPMVFGITRKRGEGGFTLIEMMIAATVFAIAALGLAQYQMYLSRHRVVDQRYTKAIYYAEEKLEELRRKGFAAVTNESAPFATGIHGDTNFSYTVDVVFPELKKKFITVTVSWKDPGGSVHTPPVELKTIMTK